MYIWIAPSLKNGQTSQYSGNHNDDIMSPIIQWHHSGVKWPIKFWILQDWDKLEGINLNNLAICVPIF